MFIVYYRRRKYSAWKNRNGANYQIKMLANSGMKRKHIWKSEIDANYSDGYYFDAGDLTKKYKKPKIESGLKGVIP